MEDGKQLRDEDGRIARTGLTPEEFATEEALKSLGLHAGRAVGTVKECPL